MQYQKINAKTRRNLERYAERIAETVHDLETSDNRKYRAADYDKWAAERRAQAEAIAQALEAGRAPSTPCTAWDALEAREAYRAAEKAAQDAREGFHIPNDLYIAERDALDAYHAIAHIALLQARDLAAEALAAEADAWTRKPAHYKATAAAVREITDRALIATGCRACLGRDYGDWAHPRLIVGVDSAFWQYSTPRDIDMRLGHSGEYLTTEGLRRPEDAGRPDWAEWTPAQVNKRVRAYRADVARARDMAAAYEERARTLTSKYRMLDLGDDLERALHTTV